MEQRRLKILFVTHVNQMGGANRSLFQLIKELKESYPINPYVLCPNYHCKGPSIVEKLTEIGVPVIQTEIVFFKKKNPDILHDGRSHLRYLWHNRSLYRKLHPYNFDIIHSNGTVIDLGAMLSFQLKIKHIWHLREFGDKDLDLYSIWGTIYEKVIYRRADAYIAISQCIRDHFARKVDSKKIHLIYNGIYNDVEMPISQHTHHVCQFICAGNIIEGKNQLEILRASVELLKRGVDNFHVTIVGIKSEPYYSLLGDYVRDNALTPYVSIMEEIDGIQELVANMDVGLMTSKAEAFGRVTVEYMLQNLAVIANDQGANPEIVEDGKSGLIYKNGNEKELADCMCRLIQDRTLMNTLSENGRRRAESMFLSKYNTKAIYELYLNVMRKA